MSHADFLKLLSKKANNFSVKIEQNFREMARSIARDPRLADKFLHHSVTRLAEDLSPEFRVELKKFLSRYGCRSRHRTLFIKRWIESLRSVQNKSYED